MTIEILYFALLKEQSGLSSESLSRTYATPADAYKALQKKHGFTLDPNSLKVAVNDEFAAWDTPLKSGDSLAFIPPVAGG